MSYKGLFKAKNPKKYAGNANNIVYRSSWELGYMMQLDHDDDVTVWASEELVVHYISPIDQRPHRYYPDFMVKRKSGKIEMVEIKPLKETKLPEATTNRRKLIRESMTFAKNQAKWKAAKAYCDERGWKFVILTEVQLFSGGSKSSGGR